MKQLVLLTLMLLSLAACATYKEMQPIAENRYEPRQKLSTALLELEQGRYVAAIVTLEEIITEPGVKGVTDEALFRLSVLKLLHEEKDGTLTAGHYLERLRNEYRNSSWTQQAKPLVEFLKGVAEVRRQNRELKILNNSLSRENKEMHQSIDRLKNLDMQLERKPK